MRQIIPQVIIKNNKSKYQFKCQHNTPVKILIEQILQQAKFPLQTSTTTYSNDSPIDQQNSIVSDYINFPFIIDVNIPLNVNIQLDEKDNKTINKKINGANYCFELSEEINQQIGIPFCSIQLKKENTFLNPQQLIYYQDVKDQTNLSIQCTTSFVIFYQKKNTRFKINLMDNIKTIKKLIQTKLKLNSDFELYYKNQCINDINKTYYDYQIPLNVKLNIKIKQKIKINLIKENINLGTYLVVQNCLIRELYHLIEQYHKLKQFILIYKDQQLNLFQSFEQNNIIEDNDIIIKNTQTISIINKSHQQIKIIVQNVIQNQPINEIIRSQPFFNDKELQIYKKVNNKYEQIVQSQQISEINSNEIYFDEIKPDKTIKQQEIQFLCLNNQEQFLCNVNLDSYIISIIQNHHPKQNILSILYYGQDIDKECKFDDIEIKKGELIEYTLQ